jgi:hypothetical protein
VPALPPYLFEPIWRQFEALLPEHRADHPLGCHRPRIPDRIVFEKLVEGQAPLRDRGRRRSQPPPPNSRGSKPARIRIRCNAPDPESTLLPSDNSPVMVADQDLVEPSGRQARRPSHGGHHQVAFAQLVAGLSCVGRKR